MDKLSDLELITAIAKIEKLDLVTMFVWNKAKLYDREALFDESFEEFNPLTDKAMLLDLIFKHRVSIVMNGNGDNHAFYMDKDIDIYQPDIEKFPRSILEAIVEANNEI